MSRCHAVTLSKFCQCGKNRQFGSWVSVMTLTHTNKCVRKWKCRADVSLPVDYIASPTLRENGFLGIDSTMLRQPSAVSHWDTELVVFYAILTGKTKVGDIPAAKVANSPTSTGTTIILTSFATIQWTSWQWEVRLERDGDLRASLQQTAGSHICTSSQQLLDKWTSFLYCLICSLRTKQSV